MIVEADEARIGEGLCHEHGRCTMTASNIRDVHAAFELLDDALQGRQPGVDQIGIVAWTEEPFRTAKQTRAMIVPPDAIAGLECLPHLFFIEPQRGQELECACHEGRAVFIGEHQLLLGVEIEFVARFGGRE